jgi:hypothetical protein
LSRYQRQIRIGKQSSLDNRSRRLSLPAMRRLLLLVLTCAMTFGGAVGRLRAQPEDENINREYAIKAAYLYQFARYVQWPAQAFVDEHSPVVIGVLGADPFGNVLNEIARTKQIDGRAIAIRRYASMADYKPCQILFVSASVSSDQKAAAIQMARKSSVLLVGEEPGFAEQGGTINFVMDENRIRFEINAEAAKQEQLKISSKLLSLAKIVGRY